MSMHNDNKLSDSDWSVKLSGCFVNSHISQRDKLFLTFTIMHGLKDQT